MNKEQKGNLKCKTCNKNIVDDKCLCGEWKYDPKTASTRLHKYKKTKYNQLREEIIKAVPDIEKFNFGCNVEIKIFTEKIWTIVVVDDRNLIVKPYGIKNVDVDLESVDIKYITKIIGRDITLFDIKQCLIYNGYTTKEFCEIAELWEYPNSLDEQSNELKEKLYEYIKNKNG